MMDPPEQSVFHLPLSPNCRRCVESGKLHRSWYYFSQEAEMETDFANIEGMFKINTDIVNKAIADVGPEHWFKKPGDDSNHLMWVMGHLVVHRAYALKTLGGDWTTSWAPLFARGAERVADAEYPSTEEMRTAWNQVSTELSDALRNPSEDLMA